MSDFFNDELACIRPGQIRVLLEILRDTTWRDRTFVEHRYSDRARNFAETLHFLGHLGWIRMEGPLIYPVEPWMERANGQDDQGEGVALLEALLDSPGDHLRMFAGYLGRFQNAAGVVSCPGRGELDLADTSARNFLMELGAVRHEKRTNAYFIEPPYFGAYLWAVAQKGPDSHSQLIDDLEDQHQIGHGAELAVVAFERVRLGHLLANRVQHIADKHPAAPYDIKSLTVTDATVVPRYIEVKAISPSDPAFHWSTREIEMARLLRSSFFLYLVPVHGPDDFDLSRLHVIADPYTEVYSQTSSWDKLPTHFLCRPAKPLIS